MSQQLQPKPVPTCKRCGHEMTLVRVEPIPEPIPDPDHELRTFACMCGNSDVVKVESK